MPTMEASSTTTTAAVVEVSLRASSRSMALAMVIPRSPAPSRMASSTALPVGASTSTSLRARFAAVRSVLSEWVLPAPAGAGSGCTRNGDDGDVANGPLLIGGQVVEVVGAHIEAGLVVALAEGVEDAAAPRP